MQRPRQRFRGTHDPRPWDDEFVADEKVHTVVFYGGQ
jgi:hypothetical protein